MEEQKDTEDENEEMLRSDHGMWHPKPLKSIYLQH